MPNKKTRLNYHSIEDLAADTYWLINGLMGEFQAIRLMYLALHQNTLSFKNGSTLDETEQFLTKAICWSLFNSWFYRLCEFDFLILPQFKFLPKDLNEFVAIGREFEMQRLRQFNHHILDKKTDRLFDDEEINEIHNRCYDKFIEYLIGNKSIDLMKTLGTTRDSILQKFPELNERIMRKSQTYKIPKC